MKGATSYALCIQAPTMTTVTTIMTTATMKYDEGDEGDGLKFLFLLLF